jgi:hypothetical protein
VSWSSWIVVVFGLIGLIAAAIAVQFDEPWLEVAGAAAFLILFAWIVVSLRAGASSVKSELLRSVHSSKTRVATSRPHDS